MVLDQQCSADLQVIARLLLVCVCGGRVRGELSELLRWRLEDRKMLIMFC